MSEVEQPGGGVAAVLEAAVADGVFPGCVGLVWREGELRYHGAHGHLAVHADPELCAIRVQRDTRYDLASLTKVLATTTLAALSVGQGRVTLDAPVPEPWSAAVPGATLADLLEHAAGLEAHRPYFVEVAPGDREAVLEAVARTPAAGPPRRRAVYSDLGFMILGAWLQRIWEAPLDHLVQREIAPILTREQAPVPALAFRPVASGEIRPEERAWIAPTEVYDPDLHEGEAPEWFAVRPERLAHGWVHDDNTFAMGGVAGHAGLFGTARAVLDVARAWLEPGRLPGLDANVRDRFWTPSSVPGSTRRLGWDGTPRDGSGSTADACGPRTVGHLGFTGTSLWIDPDARSIYVLVSNRVHPTRNDSRIRQVRRAFHRAAASIA